MALRLGFSVAAHLEPEILLVDEVLAVGDLAFQKKCLGKMDEVARSGRTVLLVSHNMAAIANLCTSTVLLHRGKLVNYGATADIIDQYVNLTEFEQEAGEVLSHSRHVQNVTLLSERGEPASHFMLGEPLSVEVTLKNADQIAAPVVSLFICNHYGDRLMMLGTRIQADLKIPSTSNVRLRVTTDPVNLLPGLYTLDIGVGSGFDLAEYLQGITSFTIEYADVFNTGKLPSTKQGVIAQKAVWEIL
jgi:lipopolysaccharide transport system ATP-binding protein